MLRGDEVLAYDRADVGDDRVDPAVTIDIAEGDEPRSVRERDRRAGLREAAVAVAEEDTEVVGTGARDGDIELSVAIQVGDGEPERRVADGHRRRGSEGTGAGTKPDRHIVAGLVGDGEVEPLVAVEVGRCFRMRARGREWRPRSLDEHRIGCPGAGCEEPEDDGARDGQACRPKPRAPRTTCR